MSVAAIALASAVLGSPASADWELDRERSVMNFLSVKNARIAELHHFKSITGSINASGETQLVIDLDSVETMIPIRNQRMRELLFETVRFPSATITASVPAELLALETGESKTTEVDLTLELHGQSKVYSADFTVTQAADGSLQVALREPLVVEAKDFNLDGGIEMLREVAGLESISTAVPVSANLVFVDSEG